MGNTVGRASGSGSGSGEEREPPNLDVGVAHIARVYDYWLGGKDHFEADREAGDEVMRFNPNIRSSVRANRAFLARAVRYLAAEEGIRQFLDIGTGLPSANNTHEVAQRIAPESRIVYADNDPMVLAHARALLTSSPEGRTAYLDADARDTARILTESAELLDFDQPIAVMLVAVLHLIPDEDDPYRVVADLVQTVAPGSFLLISHLPSDMHQHVPGQAEAAARINRLQIMAEKVTPRSHDQVIRFFDGTELVEPGVVPVQQWRPDSEEESSARAGMWAGLGRKP